MELMQAVEHYATAMKLAERYGNDNGDVDAANNAWRECEKAADELQEYARDVLRLLEAVKYLRGIAARGEGREMRDDETVEGFVLGYVQRLERTLRRCTAVGCRYAPDGADEPVDNGMCPNCVTPWKCNGPHELTPNDQGNGPRQAQLAKVRVDRRVMPGTYYGETKMKVDAKAVAARYDAALNAMVDKFLCWKFPEDFGPDAGVSFTPCGPHDSHHWPTGTNILTAEQAKQMFRDCVPPSCFGLDDCSTRALSVCDFADKCGK